ncbi:hypothetical protein ACN26Y_10315 [Micromonospora sp. WMMD558]|uniref:hypothetical protein n=1 Tax=unclassified Micromonospora TaxID=2617518 RepID=UPI0012B470B5|nr:hypothetical protein [Micromonospora sp. WMMC415]QGN46652.1 hypothetical protein GKC29_07215 [Micromonospora sp. WMMC415]
MTSIAVGRTIRVREDAYKFGTGTLTLVITEIISSQVIDGAIWAQLKGREVRPDWSLAVRERYAAVRLDAVTAIEPGRVG